MNLEDFGDVKRCLEGAYRKLKGYYFYNKNFLLIRSKIVDFEYDSEKMNESFSCMADALLHPRKKSSKIFFNSLIQSIDFFILPKKFEEKNPKKRSADMPVSNISNCEKSLTEVNFFIDAPVEIYILDVFWTLFIAEYYYSNDFPVKCVYGNSVRKDVVSEDIDFESNRFFKMFYFQYNSWRNQAFDALRESYDSGKDTILFSLDLKSFFYSVRFSFSQLDDFASKNSENKIVNVLNELFEKVFLKYKEKISPYRRGMDEFKKEEYPLPIGLFSSMVLGNLYLSNFDEKVLETEPVYYGRYVDDILLVYETCVSENECNADIINRVLIQFDLLQSNHDNYSLSQIPTLTIQKEKIKVVCVKHDEPKAIIDIYDKTIRVKPSQLDPIPDIDLKLEAFAERVYDVENLSSKNKIRDIGQIDISSFEVGRFFSSLLYNYSRIDAFRSSKLKKNIDENISQIEQFFSGSQCIEFYPYWGRYLSFLVMVQRTKGRKIANDEGNARAFCKKIRKEIKNIKCNNLKKELYSTTKGLTKKLQDTLQSVLNVGLYMSLSLDFDACKNNFAKACDQVKKYIDVNYFDDSLIPIPLSNYFDYQNEVSFLKMTMKELGNISSDLDKSKKLKWSPHFIYYEEVMLLIFYQRHIKRRTDGKFSYVSDFVSNLYRKVNFIKTVSPVISMDEESNIAGYRLNRVIIPSRKSFGNKIEVGVASVKFEVDTKNPTDRWKPLTYDAKLSFNNVLKGMFQYSNYHDAKILIMPELYVPIYWIKDLIRFSKKTNIAVVAGLQYVEGKDDFVHNYLLNIFPLSVPLNRFGKESLIYIREKNDYSPIEKKELSKIGRICEDLHEPEYQIFKWNGINIASFVCYELTDVAARALFKGLCDILTVSVFNPDTTYFSKIISSTSRDLHCFIAQSNTSLYGDSRITGPYDRDSKDIVRLKGGENDNVIIGSINLSKYRYYQYGYYEKLDGEIKENLKHFAEKKKVKKECKKKEKPDIKPLSARFVVKKD